MDIAPYILLLGCSIESDNRGVTALTLGAMKVLLSSFGKSDFVILQFSSEERIKKQDLFVDGNNIQVKTYYFSKWSALRCILEFCVFKFFKKQAVSELSKLILNSWKVFDANEGDSFSDIYGHKRTIRHFLDSFMVLLSGKDLTFLPQTIGPFNNFIDKTVAKYILKRLKKIYLRDTYGETILRKLKVSYDVTNDLAVYLSGQKVDYDIPPETVGININGLLYYQSYGEIVGNFNSYKMLILKLTDAIIDKGFNVLLIPHTYNTLTPSLEDDLIAIKEIAKKKEGGRLKYISNNYNAAELKFLISKLDFFIGSRMHSCIASLSTSVPTVGLGYSIKFKGTFKMFNQEVSVIDINKIDAHEVDSVIAKVLEKIKDKDQSREELIRINGNRKNLIVD